MSAAWEDGEEQWLDRLGGGEGANCNEKFKVLDQVEPHDTKLSWASHKDLGQLKPTKDRPITKTGCDGQKSLETCQEIEETRIIGLGQNKTAGQHWKRVTRIPSLSDKNQFFGIELGKRSEADIVKDLRTLKKKVRVQNNDNKCGKVGSKDVDDQSSNTSMEGIDQVERKKAEKEVLESRNRVCEMVDMAKAEEVVAATMTFKKVLVAANKVEMELFCIIIWKVWCYRNDWLHNGKSFDMNEVVWWSKNFAEEIRRARSNKEKGVAVEGRRRVEVDDRWRPLDQGWLKINCDARVDKRRRHIGYGIIVRDERGRVLWCSAQGCEANYDLDCAKTMAIYKGLQICRNMGLVNYVVESDSETVFKQIWNGGNSEANYGGILEAIRNFIADVRSVVFHHVSTKKNMVALELAKEALSITNIVVWKEDAPLCIRALVELQHPGLDVLIPAHKRCHSSRLSWISQRHKTMVYITSWDEFVERSVQLYKADPQSTRYCMKYRHCDGKLVLKVTDNKECLKFKTDQAQDAKKMEKLNNIFFALMARGPDVDMSEITGKEQMEAQPSKKGRGRKQ
ncbi:hypothetical protein LWI28_022462 [Acer negundo]|uniref:Signal recognition particle 9 kDa protein n=1 Tax=Acer negundo TaxID=4023 RepID=A0AAD5NVB4_ACENE|nr:hypothetical protein LWI28_022462 [Acer negundo]